MGPETRRKDDAEARSKGYPWGMTSILLAAFFALTISGNGGQAPQVQDSGTVDQAVETEAVAEGERKIESEDIEAAVTEALAILLDRQEGANQAAQQLREERAHVVRAHRKLGPMVYCRARPPSVSLTTSAFAQGHSTTSLIVSRLCWCTIESAPGRA